MRDPLSMVSSIYLDGPQYVYSVVCPKAFGPVDYSVVIQLFIKLARICNA